MPVSAGSVASVSTLDQSGPDPWAAKPPRVVIFVGDADTDLVGTLDHLSYRVERVEDGAPTGAEDLDPAVAAIVSDTIDGPIELCASLSVHRPVLLVSDETAFAFRLAAAKAGISALVRRPANPIELSEWLESFARQGLRESISVLIVDDDWLAGELNAAILRAAGMVVTIVTDPTQALQAIDDAQPDLILMDMQMPGVDGLNLAQIIRQSRQLLSLPIIFLSAEQDEDRQLEARRLGGDDFISKSTNPERLIALVRLRADRSKSLRSLIERDRLTGLYDHSRFKERLLLELERCRRTGAEICLVMIDIDHFKRVNDGFGHPAGDSVIRTLSSALTAGLRRIDIIGRYGGEEFGAVLLDTTPAAAQIVIDRLRQRFGRFTFTAGAQKFRVEFSAGVASSLDYPDLAGLVAAADAALYAAKCNGRNRVELATPRDELPATPAKRAARPMLM